ncbi:uncharacterized protein LTR77_010016 [Saxophila tyrrhenica]|uniref:Altered inheritance of mitochondria protein 11 n=1 Tax=Saxophila tyrrhenica TaxID=1690608 RepID=A0AAV9NWZ0_9PEZI|nr:hypothetical protein LTR77_010016 [Saxophila tyrrhenica]
MSLSDFYARFLAPGDVRARSSVLEQEQRDEAAALEKKRLAAASAKPPRIDAAHRVRRQNAMLYGGLVFTGLSAVVTRRSLRGKKVQVQGLPAAAPGTATTAPAAGSAAVPPPTSTTIPGPTTTVAPPGQAQGSKADASLDALSALGLATLNVFSTFMLGAGIAMSYFDIADLEDIKQKVNQGLGNEVNEDGDAEGDREIETWIAEVLARKDGKEGGGIGGLREGVLEKMVEMEEGKKKGR